MGRAAMTRRVGLVAQVVGPLVVVSALSEVATDAGQNVELEFFAVTAQIIPVLTLAVVVEATTSYASVRNKIGDVKRTIREMRSVVEDLDEAVTSLEVTATRLAQLGDEGAHGHAVAARADASAPSRF